MATTLTSRAEDYSQRYNDLVKYADLAENSAVRGCMIIKPYGYAIWENMRDILDRCSKLLGNKMLIFHYLSLNLIFQRKHLMLRDLLKNVL